jgi:hypothetical protein
VIGGSIFILLVYSLLGEDMRFSRAVIIFGTLWTFFCTNVLRYIIRKLNIKNYPVGERHNNRILIIGDEQETSRVSMLLNMTAFKSEFIGFINYRETDAKSLHFIGNISQLKDIIAIYQIGELVFCGKNMTAKEIISLMSDLQDTNLEYKIAPSESAFIIGSNSINASGDIYMLDINSVGKKENLRKKRVFDIVFSVFCFIFYPILFWFIREKRRFFCNIIHCFIGKKTWVGYTPIQTDLQQHSLPKLKTGIFFPTDALNLKHCNDDIIQQINTLYARNYKLLGDLNIIAKSMFSIRK